MLGIVWVIFHAVWSFIGISTLVNLPDHDQKLLSLVDSTIWTVTYIDSACGLLLSIVPVIVMFVLLALSLMFFVIMGVLACGFSVCFRAVPTIVEETNEIASGGEAQAVLVSSSSSLSDFDVNASISSNVNSVALSTPPRYTKRSSYIGDIDPDEKQRFLHGD